MTKVKYFLIHFLWLFGLGLIGVFTLAFLSVALGLPKWVYGSMSFIFGWNFANYIRKYISKLKNKNE